MLITMEIHMVKRYITFTQVLSFIKLSCKNKQLPKNEHTCNFKSNLLKITDFTFIKNTWYMTTFEL